MSGDDAMWGIHNVRRDFSFVDEGIIGLGWNRLGDLRTIGDDREDVKAALAEAIPEAPDAAIGVWATIILRFGYELAPGDLVVHPSKPDRTINLGRIAGDYRFAVEERRLRHRRDVEWLQTGIPRDALSAGARHELGASQTLFRVTRHQAELRRFLEP